MSQLQYKPLGSLSATLLARKGTAKPAMRPQYYPTQVDSHAQVGDFDPSDCGWNDMGDGVEAAVEAVAHVAPICEGYDVAGNVVEIEADEAVPVAVIEQPVLRQQQAIAARLAPIEVDADVAESPQVSRRTPGAALTEGRRAAFTLRLDGARHLKLRLACTLRGRSAQMLLTDALDRLLAEQSDVIALAAQVNSNR